MWLLYERKEVCFYPATAAQTQLANLGKGEANINAG